MSSRGWIYDLVAACVAAGIRDYVVCAGARNMPLIVALEDLSRSGELGEVRLYAHFEERAAGFFALGRCMSVETPCAVVTTSGTAVAELLPSVIEAHYQKRPLVVISADRPVVFRGTGAPQAIEQVDLLGGYVEGVQDVDYSDRIDLFRGWGRCRPWHLNVCMGEEDLKQVEPKLAKVSVCDVEGAGKGMLDMRPVLEVICDSWRGLVVMLGGLEPEDREEVWHFLRDLGVPVLADSTSGLREVLGDLVLVAGDRLLCEKPPAAVLRIGDVPVGRFWRDLEEMPDVKVVSISRTGFSGLARESELITGDISRLVRALGAIEHVGDSQDLLKHSKRYEGRTSELLESFPESEPGMVRMLSVMATMGSRLYLGNSLPIREWNDFAQREVPYELVRANRGANGIDGQVATWLGATADDEGAWGVFGDLTALYDLSVPSLLGQVETRGRVLVVINNGGGKIFQRLPVMKDLGDQVSRLITHEHEWSFESWARMWGMDYICIRGIEDFDFEPGERVKLVEVIPDAVQTEAFWAAWKEVMA